MKLSTANPDEIAQFSRIADKWWDPNGEFRPLHNLNPARLTYIKEQLSNYFNLDPQSIRPLEGLTLIDVGCGGGLLTEPMSRLGAEVTGIDAGSETIEAARHHANALGLEIDYQHILPENLGSEIRRFDIVLNMEVIEHVDERELFLKTTAKLLRPGGAMFVSSLNRTLKSLIFAKFGAEYVLRWLPIGTHSWNNFVRPSELASEICPYGMHVRDITGLSYNALDKEWRHSRDLDINYIMTLIKET